MITTETSLLCQRCFTPLSPRGICPICGKRPPRVSTPAGHLAQGTRLKERYVVSSAIGEGGFGITYLGYDAMKRRKVAIKEYFPSSVVMRDGCSAVVRSENMRSRFSAGKKRFTDEAKNMAAIKDLDGVPSVLDYFSENGTAYIVMEYLGGETLKNRISGKGKMREEEALRGLRRQHHPHRRRLRQTHRLRRVRLNVRQTAEHRAQTPLRPSRAVRKERRYRPPRRRIRRGSHALLLPHRFAASRIHRAPPPGQTLLPRENVPEYEDRPDQSPRS